MLHTQTGTVRAHTYAHTVHCTHVCGHLMHLQQNSNQTHAAEPEAWRSYPSLCRGTMKWRTKASGVLVRSAEYFLKASKNLPLEEATWAP